MKDNTVMVALDIRDVSWGFLFSTCSKVIDKIQSEELGTREVR